MPCKEPTCPVCGKKIRRDLITRLDLGFHGFRNRMLTLTRAPGCPREMGECLTRFKAYLSRPRLSHRDHQKHLNWFYYGQHHGEKRPRLRKRAPGRRSRTFWMKEPHLGGGANHGQLHAHMAISVFIPQGILNAAWRYATDGYGQLVYAQANQGEDIRRVGRYMSKYITKSLSEYFDGFDKGERRYQFSQHPEFRLPKWSPPFKVQFILNRDAHVYGLPNLEVSVLRSAWNGLRASSPGGPSGPPTGSLPENHSTAA